MVNNNINRLPTQEQDYQTRKLLCEFFLSHPQCATLFTLSCSFDTDEDESESVAFISL